MSLKDFTTLAGNLQELCAAAGTQSPFDTLVPGLWGNRFYSSKSWLGRILNFFYTRFERYSKKWREKTIVKAMEKTHCLYNRLKEDADRYNQMLLEAIHSRMDGHYISPKDQRRAYSFLTKWSSATHPLKKALKSNPHLVEFMRNGFLDKKGHASAVAPMRPCNRDIARIVNQKIIDLESLYGSPLPFKALYHLSKTRKSIHHEQEDGLPYLNQLPEEDKREIIALANSLERKQSSLNIHELNRGLRALVHAFAITKPRGRMPELVPIVETLACLKVSLFNQRDNAHIAWRDNLKPGDKLLCNGIEVILGNPLPSQKASKDDNTLVFELANTPDLVAVIGINRLTLPLKASLAERMGFGIRHAEFVQIAMDGSFALVEKLETKLSDHTWTTTHHAHPPPEDLELIGPIINTVNWFIRNDSLPILFSPEYMRYSKRGVLKSTKYNIPVPFSYIEMEKVILSIANGNQSIFDLIMIDSDMRDIQSDGRERKHPHGIFFNDTIETACKSNTHTKKEESTTQGRSEVSRITDFRYVDHAKDLAKQVHTMKSTCLATLRERYEELPLNIQGIINEEAYNVYFNCYHVSTLPTNMADKILERILARSEFSPQEVSEEDNYASG